MLNEFGESIFSVYGIQISILQCSVYYKLQIGRIKGKEKVKDEKRKEIDR